MVNDILMLPLSNLLEIWEQKEIEKFVETFSNNGLNRDIEDFLKHKSISFEKMNISRTTLILKNNQIVGYFSIAFKSLIIEKEFWNSISNTLKKKLMPGYNIKKIVPPVSPQAILVGQLGKNYAVEPMIDGKDLLALAEAQVYQAQKHAGGRFVWLECDNEPKLIEFYIENGYQLLGKIEKNQLILIKKI